MLDKGPVIPRQPQFHGNPPDRVQRPGVNVAGFSCVPAAEKRPAAEDSSLAGEADRVLLVSAAIILKVNGRKAVFRKKIKGLSVACVEAVAVRLEVTAPATCPACSHAVEFPVNPIYTTF